jgi:hypothetical protein
MNSTAVPAACLAIALAACSGPGAIPGASQISGDHARLAKVSFRIRVPKSAHTGRTHAARRGPAYVSPAVAGMTVAIVGPTTTTATFGLLSNSPGCAGAQSGTLCTISLPGLKPCTGTASCYTASVSTYDGVTCASACSIPANSNELSAAQHVAFAVVQSAANVVSVTLGGVPKKIVVTPSTPGYLQGDASGLKLFGPSVQQAVVETQDSDGNAIVGAGAPALSANSPSSGLAVTTMSPATPNLFNLQAITFGVPPLISPNETNVRFTAIPAVQSGAATIQRTVPVRVAHTAVYSATYLGVVAYLDGNIVAPQISITGSNTGLSTVEGVCLDANGTAYVTDGNGSGSVFEFAASANGNVAPNAKITGAATGLSDPIGCTVDSHGTLYVANLGNGVTEYAPGASGNAAPIGTIAGTSTTLVAAFGVAVDANGYVYVSDASNHVVSIFSPSVAGNVPPLAQIGGAATGMTSTGGISLDNGGTLYISNPTSNGVSEYAAGSTGNVPPNTVLSGANTGLTLPSRTAVDAAGILYVASGSLTTSVRNVTEFLPGASGSIFPFQTISLSGAPTALAVIPGRLNQ